MSEDNSTPESAQNASENPASEAAPKKSYVKKPFAKKGPPPKPARPPERIAKVLARAGLASRREVERLIGLGKIAVNGRLLDTPATTVSADDLITVEGKPIRKAEPTRVWRYHKPVGLMTTHQDPQGRPTVFNSLPEELPRVISVGRLDINSEGLLLLTNDGELARALELPTTGWTRVYRVRALGRTTQESLDTLKNGVTVEGVQYGPIEAKLDKAQEKADGRANLWITVSLNEGKNREVRKVLDSLGLKVNRLIRLAYGPFQLGDIEPGEVEEIGPRVVRELLGDKIDPRNLPPEGETQTRTPMRLRRTDGEGAGGRRGGGERFAPRGEGRPAGGREERRERPVSKEEAFRRKYEAKNFGDRDFDERPRFEGDGQARDRRPEREEREWKPRAERPRGEFKPRSEGGFKPRGEGDFKPRGDRNFGDKPRFDKPRGERSFGDRPQRDFKPRAEGDFKPRGDRNFGDRPQRDFKPRGEGDAPRGDFKPRFDKPRGERSFGDRPQRDFKPRGEGDFKPRGDRPQRDFKPRGEGDAPRGDFKPRFDKPRGERSFGDRPQRDFKPRGEGDFKPRGDRNFGDRPQRDFKPRGEGDAPRGDFKPRFDKPRGERSFGDRPQRDFKPRGEGDFKPRGDRPAGKSFGGKPGGGKSLGGKPGGFKPGGRPGGFSGGPRKPRPE